MYPVGKECERDRNSNDSIVIFMSIAYKEKTLFYIAIIIIDLLLSKGSNYSLM